MNALLEVLTGRDRVPAWRSASTRRAATLLGWLGFALLAVSAALAVTVGRGHNPGSYASAGGWLAVVLAVSAALPLAARHALLAWRVAFLGALLTPLIPGQSRADAGLYAVLAVAYAVAGLRYGSPVLWWMAALTLIPVWLWTGPDWTYPARLTVGFAAFAAALHLIATWRRDRVALRTQTQNVARERERGAVLTERARIARELHDVVAHHMSMIAVQAETAPYRLAAKPGVTDLPEPVRAEFAALSGAAREALTEMRGLLGVLRSDPAAHPAPHPAQHPAPHPAADALELAPQPRLEDLPALVEAARRAGSAVTLTMPVTLTLPPDHGPLPPGVGLAAYRIVQESLSNAGRHAPGAAVSIVVEAEPRSVLLEIRNEPSAAAPRATDGTGHGLTGMRERAALLGGSLTAGPQADGGFAVRAVLPAGGRR